MLNRDVSNVLGLNLTQTLEAYDVMLTQDEGVKQMYAAGPAGIRTTKAFSQDCRYPSLDTDREEGCIRTREHAYSQDGGLAVLYGNIAADGCIVKTAGVDKDSLTFRGPAKVFESQDEAVEAILGGKVVAGDVVVIRYEGPKGAGYAGNALSDHLSEIHGVGQELCLTDRWPFLWRDIRFVYRPCVSRSRQWWVDWFGTRWRFHQYRYSEPWHCLGC